MRRFCQKCILLDGLCKNRMAGTLNEKSLYEFEKKRGRKQHVVGRVTWDGS